MERTEHVHRDIREFLNSMPMGRKQWTVFLVCFAATAIEGFDTIVIGFLAPAISHDGGYRARRSHRWSPLRVCL